MISDYPTHGIYLLAQTFTYQSLHSISISAEWLPCQSFAGFMIQVIYCKVWRVLPKKWKRS